MPHSCITGMQQSGKTTLALAMARAYRRSGVALLALDPHLSPHWQADWITDDLEKFLLKAKASRRCALFVEEVGDESDGQKMIGKRPGFSWLFTQAHHFGHVSHYLSQYHAQVGPIVRGNVRHAYLFSMGLKSAKEWAEQLGQPTLPDLVPTLREHQFIITGTQRVPPRVAQLHPEDVRRLHL